MTKIRHRNYLILVDRIFQPTCSGGILGGIELTLEPIPPNVEDGHSDQGSWLRLCALTIFPISARFDFHLGSSLDDPSALQGNFRSRLVAAGQ